MTLRVRKRLAESIAYYAFTPAISPLTVILNSVTYTLNTDKLMHRKFLDECPIPENT